MLHRRYFLSVIILTACINYNIVAMGLFYGDSNLARMYRTASHVAAFGNMIHKNKDIIVPTAVVAVVGTVLFTSYDKPKVMYSTLGTCMAYLFYKNMRLEKNMDQLIALHERNANDLQAKINEVKTETSSLRDVTTQLNEDIGKIIPDLNDRIDPLAQHVLSLKDLIEANSTNVQKQEESITALTAKISRMQSGITELTTNQNSLKDLVVTEANKTRELNTQNTERILTRIQHRSDASFRSGGLMGGVAMATSFKPSSYQAQSKIPS